MISMTLQKVLIWMEAVHGKPFHIKRDLGMQKVYIQKKNMNPETLRQNITTFISKQLKGW